MDSTVRIIECDYALLMFFSLAAPVSIDSLRVASATNSIFTLNCSSSGSPATMVTWTKDGRTLASSALYQMTQILSNGIMTTYSNLLTINAGPYAVTGDYSCEVSNQIGTARRNATVRG